MIVIYVWNIRFHKEFLAKIYKNQIMNKTYRKKKIYLIMKDMGFGLGLEIRIKIYHKKINNKKVPILKYHKWITQIIKNLKQS